MTAYLLTNHLLNFAAPALVVALLLVLLAPIFSSLFASKRPMAQLVWARAAIIFIVNLLTLAAGLVFFGNDGKMASYAAMVVAAALTYWVLIRGWTRR